MKVLVVHSAWIGGWMEHVVNALKETGHQVVHMPYERQYSPLRIFKIHNIVQVRNWLENKSRAVFNNTVIKQFNGYKPDLFLTMNESYLLPETIKYIQKNKCTTACFVADNPFDSHRYSYFPISLKFFKKIFVSDRIWIPSIRNIAPKSEILKIPSGGGFNKELFFPVKETEITDVERDELGCDISFTGESYGMRGEGGYRSGILDQLGNYNLKIWGDERWKLRFPYYDNLEKAYQGGRLPFGKLRKLYHISTINLNMPSPQVFTGFQPRVFEIAACKGFQIVDWREELDELFTEDELVTFKDIPDLLEKVEYFVKNPGQRKPYIEKLFEKVWNNHTWEKCAKEIIDIINNN